MKKGWCTSTPKTKTAMHLPVLHKNTQFMIFLLCNNMTISQELGTGSTSHYHSANKYTCALTHANSPPAHQHLPLSWYSTAQHSTTVN
jgi:hypothetical protein